MSRPVLSLTRALCLCLLLTAAFGSAPAASKEPSFTRHVFKGPIKTAVPIACRWFPDPDGHLVYYATSGAETVAQFARYDPATDRTRSWACPEINEIWAMAQDAEGRIYFGGRGNMLFRYDPRKDDVERVGHSPSRRFIRALCTAPDGKVYGGDIYSNNLLWVYDPRQNTFAELGSPKGCDYVCDLHCLPSGKLLVAMGTPAGLYRYDPATRQCESLLSEPYSGDNFAYVLTPFGRRICLRLAITEQHLLLDGNDGRVLRKIEPPDGKGSLGVALVDRQQRLWMSQTGRNGWLVLDPATDRLTPVDRADVERLPAAEVPVQLLTNMNKDFRLTVSSSLKPGATTRAIRLPIEPTPTAIFSVGVGPDECIYIEAYQWLHVTRVDPQTEKVADLGYLDPRASGEIYSWLTVGHELLIANYTHGRVYRFDPKKPFVQEPAVGANPRYVGQFDNDIYRPAYMCMGPNRRVWVAGPCGYGIAGHGLGWLDLDSGAKASRRLGGNDVSGLARAGENLIAVAQGGQLVLWNAANDRPDGSPLFTDVRHVLVDPKEAGVILLLVGSELQRFNVASRSVVHRWPLPAAGLNMLCASQTDLLTASGSSGVWVLQTSDGRWAQIDTKAPSVRYMVSNAHGDIFYAAGRDLVCQKRP